MKSKFIPCLVMLLAGLVCSLISIDKNVGLMDFTTRLLGVLVLFYIIGCILKVVLDKAILLLGDKEKIEENVPISDEKTESDENMEFTDAE